MNKRVIILGVLCLILISGCTSNELNRSKLHSGTYDGKSISNNPLKIPSEEIREETNGQTNQHSTEDLPPCPTSTATGCRIVEGVTKSGREMRGNTQTIGCSGNGTVALISPMKIEDIGIIIPMGAMIGGHVTPIDHMYFQPTIFHSPPDTYNVYADADGIIQSIQSEHLGNGNRYRKYRFIIEHTCDFYSIYNLLTSLSPEILDITGTVEPGGSSSQAIRVHQGQLLGKIGGQTLDLSVNYDKVRLGFIVPSHYEGESWKIHTVDPFDYFAEPDKGFLLAKNVRQAEPRGGKIDYDIDGRLVGNWFVEHTGGYNTGRNDTNYWKTHVAFVYDPIDPVHIIISLGNFTDIAVGLDERDRNMIQFSARGNKPDPKDVSVSSGIVRYELVETSYILGDTDVPWSRMDFANNIKARGGTFVKGVVLIQMVEDRKLKLEIFPGKSSSEVDGFFHPTMYER